MWLLCAYETFNDSNFRVPTKKATIKNTSKVPPVRYVDVSSKGFLTRTLHLGLRILN